MTDDVNAGANPSGASGGGGGGGGTGPTNGEPATGPVSGSPSSSRPLLPRIKRSSVVAFVNETLDAVDQLADKLADTVGLRRTTSGPPAPPASPPPPPAPEAPAPPPPI